MARHAGGCHCGALRIEFATAAPLAPRECQCSFCRKHHARSVSDPAGEALLALASDTVRYRFGTGSAEFLVCGRCGVYVGAVQDIGGELYAVLNLTAFAEPHLQLPGQPMDYDGETNEERTTRRRARWTPARVVER